MVLHDEQINQVLDLFTRFFLEELDDEWVQNVVDSNFTEVDDLPMRFDEAHAATNLSALFYTQTTSLRQWVDSISLSNLDEGKNKSGNFASVANVSTLSEMDNIDASSKFWCDLSKITKLSSLTSLFFYYVHRGQRYDAGEEEHDLGIQAASLYFLLLCVPGSNAFRLFHPILYLRSLDLLRLTTKLRIGISSPRKGSAKGHRKNTEERVLSSQGADDDIDHDEDGELAILTPQEACKLTRALNVLMSDFIRLVQYFSLKHSPESIEETVCILVEVTCSEIKDARAVFLDKHGPATITGLVYNAYVALQCLCSSLHGKVDKIATTVMKHVLPNILMTSRGLSDLSTRALGVIRDHSLIFVRYIVAQIKEASYDGVYILVQHLCFRVPNKADFRQKTAQSVVEILRQLPLDLYISLMKWFHKLAHNEKASHRLFTLEIIAKMLGEEERQEGLETPGAAVMNNSVRPRRSDCNADDTPDLLAVSNFNLVDPDHSVAVPIHRNILSHKFLLSIIFSRCRDVAATVRAKALSLLADCTLSDNPTIVLAMKQIFSMDRPVVFTTPHIDDGGINIESPMNEVEESTKRDSVDDQSVSLPNAAMVMALLRRRAKDDKVMVRKNALQVMENLMKLDKNMASAANLKTLADHCRDPALLVRKQMVMSLTQMLELYPADVVDSWVTGVLPAILDPEMKVQEKVIEVLHSVLLGRLVPPNHCDASEHNELPWLVVQSVSRLAHHKILRIAVTMWGRSLLAKPSLVSVVKSHVGGTYNAEAWLLLSLLTHCLPVKAGSDFAVTACRDYCQRIEEIGWHTMTLVLRVLCNIIKEVPEVSCIHLRDCIVPLLHKCSVVPGLIAPLMDLLTLINSHLYGEGEQGRTELQKWVVPLLDQCDEHMKSVLFSPEKIQLEPDSEELLFRTITLLGEAGLLWPSGVSKRIFLMIQSLAFHEESQDDFSPPRIPSTQTQSSQAQRLSYSPSNRIQAISVAVLGKLLLANECRAKRLVPALGMLLNSNCGSTIKTNIIIVLSDMCVRYATVVDPLLPQITACLRDCDLQVRRITLTMLVQLLQEDYLKLKGSFFYRILQCLCDEEKEIRDIAIFFLTERLLKRFPKIFSQHFIECIFHYNCYEKHEFYNRFTQNKQEKELFSLTGAANLDKRLSIYKFMLEQMPDDQRFAMTQRLCQDVLGGVVDERIGAKGSDAVLRDTLLVLSCDEIKLASLKARPEEDQATSQEEQAQIAGQAIKKTIISQVVKRNVIENIVPILIALKHKLEQQRSPLMKQLLLYIKEIMCDYKNEVKEILAGDKQLASEIDFDLKKLEEHQKEEELEQRRTEQARLNAGKKRQLDKGSVVPCPNGGQSPGSAAEARTILNFSTVDESHSDSHMTLLDNEENSKNNDSSASRTENKRLSRSRPPMPAVVSSAVEHLSPKKLPTTRKSLLVTAMLNSQRIASEQRVGAGSNADVNNVTDLSLSPKLMESLNKSRASCGESVRSQPVSGLASDESMDVKDSSEIMDESQNDSVNINNSNVTLPESMRTPQQIDSSKNAEEGTNKSSENFEVPKTPAARAMEERRQELLRAISTPTSLNVVKNITFINKTQEVSAISINASAVSTSADDQQNKDDSRETLLVHLMSPQEYAKDEEFSKLRRNSVRNLGKVFSRTRALENDALQANKRPSCGLFESLEHDEGAISSLSGEPNLEVQSQGIKRRRSKAKKKNV